MHYREIIRKLFQINNDIGVKTGLENIHRLDAILNTPHKKFPTIHIAGTNGKGSVTTKIAKAFEYQGNYKVGLYTSPHISSFRERIQINGQLIPEKTIEKLLSALFTLCETHKIPATFFELTTALAFSYFAEENVDIAVIETGLGGRLDATNIIHPLLSIITSISLEHTSILGDSIDKISAEKAGIIKPYIPVLIGPSVSSPFLKEIAKNNNSPLTKLFGSFDTYDEENSAIAKKALELVQNNYNLSVKAIENGIKKRPPCRMEEFFYNDCLIILDVAHNPDGFHKLYKSLKYKYPKSAFRFILGLSKNKDIEGCLAFIKDKGTHFHLVEASNGRQIPVTELASLMKKIHYPKDSFSHCENIELTIKEAAALAAKQKEIIVVCGTFFIMSAVRKILGIKEPIDEIDLNEKFSSARSPN